MGVRANGSRVRHRSYRCFKVYFCGSVVVLAVCLPLELFGAIDVDLRVSDVLWSVPFCISLAGIGGLIFSRRLWRQEFWKFWFFGYVIFTVGSLAWGAFDLAGAISESPELWTPLGLVVLGLGTLLLVNVTAIEFHALFIYAFRAPHIWRRNQRDDQRANLAWSG